MKPSLLQAVLEHLHPCHELGLQHLGLFPRLFGGIEPRAQLGALLLPRGALPLEPGELVRQLVQGLHRRKIPPQIKTWDRSQLTVYKCTRISGFFVFVIERVRVLAY